VTTRPTVAVIGGGITGQMVQWAIPDAKIYDWKPRPTAVLTRNYGGNYLWRPITHPDVEHRQFLVVTEIDGRPATPESVMAYKIKIGKDRENIGPWEKQFQHQMTGWDFMKIPNSTIHYNHRLVSIEPGAQVMWFDNSTVVQYDVLISTIPLYSLLSMLRFPPIHGLRFAPIYVKKYPAPPAQFVGYHVNYLADPSIESYRYTDRDGERHYESLVPLSQPYVKLAPGKIWDHPGVADVLRDLSRFRIYPIGRYGEWDSNQLVHETWERICLMKKAMDL